MAILTGRGNNTIATAGELLDLARRFPAGQLVYGGVFAENAVRFLKEGSAAGERSPSRRISLHAFVYLLTEGMLTIA